MADSQKQLPSNESAGLKRNAPKDFYPPKEAMNAQRVVYDQIIAKKNAIEDVRQWNAS